MYTAILRRVLSTYTIILRIVNRMKIFIFVYIRRLGSLVAQGIGGLYRSCFGTRNRNDNRNGVGGRGVCCSCLGTPNRNGTAGKIRWIKEYGFCLRSFIFWQEIEKICRIL